MGWVCPEQHKIWGLADWKNGCAECEVKRLELEVERMRDAGMTIANEVEQILGKALGYPPYDESVMQNPDGTVCVGDHVPQSLAMEAAKAVTLAMRLAAFIVRAHPIYPESAKTREVENQLVLEAKQILKEV